MCYAPNKSSYTPTLFSVKHLHYSIVMHLLSIKSYTPTAALLYPCYTPTLILCYTPAIFKKLQKSATFSLKNRVFIENVTLCYKNVDKNVDTEFLT